LVAVVMVAVALVAVVVVVVMVAVVVLVVVVVVVVVAVALVALVALVVVMVAVAVAWSRPWSRSLPRVVDWAQVAVAPLLAGRVGRLRATLPRRRGWPPEGTVLGRDDGGQRERPRLVAR